MRDIFKAQMISVVSLLSLSFEFRLRLGLKMDYIGLKIIQNTPLNVQCFFKKGQNVDFFIYELQEHFYMQPNPIILHSLQTLRSQFTKMKVQASPSNFCVVKALKITDYKITSLQISKQDLSQNAKLDPTKLFILKQYACNRQIIQAKAIQSWVQKTRGLHNLSTVVSASVQQKDDKMELHVVQKYMPYGDLTELIRPGWEIDCDLLLNLAQNVKSFHDQGIVIANLKPQNILLSKNQKQTFITDARIPFLDKAFQASNEYFKMKQNLYTAPEIIEDGEYFDEAGDILALSLIFLELAANKRLKDRQKTSINDHISILKKFGENSLQACIKVLIRSMIWKDLRQRASIEEVIAELKKIKNMQISQQILPNNVQFFKLYLPLMNLSPNIAFYLVQFNEKFTITVNRQQIQFMVDDKFQLFKMQVSIDGWSQVSTMTYSQLGQKIKRYFSSIKELYQLLRSEPNNLKITNTGFLMFQCVKKAQNQDDQQKTKKSTKTMTQKQQYPQTSSKSLQGDSKGPKDELTQAKK